MTRRLADQQGISAIEIVLFTTISIMIGVAIRPFFSRAATMQNTILGGDTQGRLARVCNQIESDMLEANPPSVDFTTLPPNSANLTTFGFNKLHYDLNQVGTPVTHVISYNFQANPGAGTGSLVRTLDGESHILIDGLQAPTTTYPLFAQDQTVKNVLIVTLSCKTSSTKTTRQVRRIAIKG